MSYDDETIAAAMNRELFLAPDLIGEGEGDPLLRQALQNVDDDVENAKARAAAKAAPEARAATSSPKAVQAVAQPKPNRDLCRMLARTIALLGRKYTAVIAGAAKTGAVEEWFTGAAAPSRDGMARLRLTFSLAEILGSRADDENVRQWFLGENVFLGGERPIAVISFQAPSAIEDRLRAAATSAVRSRQGSRRPAP